MTTIGTRIAAMALAALVGSAAAVAMSGGPAQAAARGGGSLVYSKGGNIHLARADGSHDIVFEKGGWYWPSMDNHGVIAAERQDRTAPDGTRGYTIHRFRQSGRQLSRQNTPSSLSTPSCPAYPSSHVSLSPDGSKIGYDWMGCTGDIFATWTPSTRFRLHTKTDYFAPGWLSNTSMTISHFGTTVTASQAQVGVWRTGGGASGWTASLADAWATVYHATATRNGRRIALIEDDAADYFGTPHRVRLVFGTARGPARPITRRCSLTLPAAQYRAWDGAMNANLSFRPDGNVLAFDSNAGIFKVNTRSLAGCSARSLNKKLWIKGGIDPSFSPAADTRR
jgi:hypothetical protein